MADYNGEAESYYTIDDYNYGYEQALDDEYMYDEGFDDAYNRSGPKWKDDPECLH